VSLAKQFEEWRAGKRMMVVKMSKQVKTKEEEEEEEEEERTDMAWTKGQLRTKEEQWENIYIIKVKKGGVKVCCGTNCRVEK
jgi:hypothetical protein